MKWGLAAFAVVLTVFMVVCAIWPTELMNTITGMVTGELEVETTPEECINTSIEGVNCTYVELSIVNDYRDEIATGALTRDFTSGEGTGAFIGDGFEFARGDCSKTRGKWSDQLGCDRVVFRNDWCARSTENSSIRYTLRFLSWTSGTPGDFECIGNCEDSNNRTAYIRIQYNGTSRR